MASSKAFARLTPTGTASSACLMAVPVVGAAARKLAPDSLSSAPLFALTVVAAVEFAGRMAFA